MGDDTSMNERELFEYITELLAEYDFDYLIDIGCPRDEYAPEARRIATFVMNNTKYLNKYVIADDIQVVFLHLLGVFPEISDCLEIADKILEKLN